MISDRTPLSLRFGAALGDRQGDLARTLERLSSGLRINRAADDAAGLGVATNLDTASRSLQVAQRNVGDAMSVADTADAALHEVADHLQRMRELAVAAASETYDDDEREYLDAEFGERIDEIDRIAHATEVLGTRVIGPGAVDIIVMVDVSGSMGERFPRPDRTAADADALQAEGLDVSMALVEVSSLDDPGDGSRIAAPLTSTDAGFDAALAGIGITGVGGMDPYNTMLDVTGVEPLAGTSTEPDQQRSRDGATQKIIIYASDAGQEIALGTADEATAGDSLAQAGWKVHALVRTGPHGAAFDDLVAATGGSMQDMNPLGLNMATMLGNIADDIRANARPIDGLEVQAGSRVQPHRGSRWGFRSMRRHGLGIDQESIGTVAEARSAIDALDAALDLVNSGFAKIGATRNRLENAANIIGDQRSRWRLHGPESRTPTSWSRRLNSPASRSCSNRPLPHLRRPRESSGKRSSHCWAESPGDQNGCPARMYTWSWGRLGSPLTYRSHPRPASARRMSNCLMFIRRPAPVVNHGSRSVCSVHIHACARSMNGASWKPRSILRSSVAEAKCQRSSPCRPAMPSTRRRSSCSPRRKKRPPYAPRWRPPMAVCWKNGVSPHVPSTIARPASTTRSWADHQRRSEAWMPHHSSMEPIQGLDARTWRSTTLPSVGSISFERVSRKPPTPRMTCIPPFTPGVVRLQAASRRRGRRTGDSRSRSRRTPMASPRSGVGGSSRGTSVPSPTGSRCR